MPMEVDEVAQPDPPQTQPVEQSDEAMDQPSQSDIKDSVVSKPSEDGKSEDSEGSSSDDEMGPPSEVTPELHNATRP